MTLEEKIGLMLHGTAQAAGKNSPLATIGRGTEYDQPQLRDMLLTRGVLFVISRLIGTAGQLAEQNNALQRIAAQGRLGIPAIVSTDPRHHLVGILGASTESIKKDGHGFTIYPGSLGQAAAALGAAGADGKKLELDRNVVLDFAQVVGREYRAVGFQMALSPQADLATSPRWPRSDGTFGEDPNVARQLAGAYVEGAQGSRDGPTPSGVATVVKHWVGYGGAEDGYDGHNYYGRYSAFPGGSFDSHVDAFSDCFKVNVAGVMPTYNILRGISVDGIPTGDVGASFSSPLITNLLRVKHNFQGLVLSDWAITSDLTESGRSGTPPQTPPEIAMPWGVEHLDRPAKFAKCIMAGVDQLGGESDPQPLLEAVNSGMVPIARVDQAVERILVLMFKLGVFENPLVDTQLASKLVGSEASRAHARKVHVRSVVALKRDQGKALRRGTVVVVHGMPLDPFKAAGLVPVTEDSSDAKSRATAAVVRLQAPYELLHPGFFFGRMQHEGSLEFKQDNADLLALQRLSKKFPDATHGIVFLDRAAVLTPILPHCTTLHAEFGTSADILVSILMGEQPAGGRLPFQISRSMENVLKRTPDTPRGDPDPLFDVGFGIVEGGRTSAASL